VRTSNNWPTVFPIIIGTIAFYIVVGPRVLHPTNIAWLDNDNMATCFLGWHVFRNSPWAFPLGLNPQYGLELSNSIVMSDSNPLLALLFKPLAPFLPKTFQYFGFWIYTCFVLQAYFGWKLTGLVSNKIAFRIPATGLFVFSPPMLFRVGFHLSFAGHFLILAALYLYLRPLWKRRSWSWLCLLAIAALVHAYILFMVTVLWLTDLIALRLSKKRSIQYDFLECVGIVIALGLLCWQSGYYTVENSEQGYGFFRMNLLSIVNPYGWSYVLKDIPQAAGDYEGFNFLGLGSILVLIFGFPVLLERRGGIIKTDTRRVLLLMSLTCLTLFAVTSNIGIASINIDFLHRSHSLMDLFRSSGRMFWPVFYAILLASISIIVRGYRSAVTTSLLTVALMVQITDTSAGWIENRKVLMSKSARKWTTPLKNPFWDEAATKYNKVRFVMPSNPQYPLRDWRTFASYAARNGLATDVVFLARIKQRQLDYALEKARFAITTGNFEQDSLYILDTKSLELACDHLNRSSDLLARIDGFNVLAPNFKKCPECLFVGEEISCR
jgi:hypothetical protein